MIRVKLNTKNMAHIHWVEAANMAVYIINRVFLRPMSDNISYEIWKGRKPKLSYLHVFCNKCYVLKDREHFGLFDARSDEGLLLGYSMSSHAFHVFNKRTSIVIESINITLEDVKHNKEYLKD